MKKRSIPAPNSNQTEINRAVKENLEQIMGQRGERLEPLPTTATTSEVIAKINDIIERLQ